MAPLARALSLVLMCCAAWPVQALEFTLPANAKQTATRDIALDQEAVPTGPFANGTLPVRMIEGPVTRHTYRIPSSGMTPLQILVPIRTQLEAAGYEILLDCDAPRCGGFDFRFGIDVLPAPNMYVNIRDFHFISAALPGAGTAVTLLASAALGTGYLQIVQVGGEAPDVNIPNVQPSEPESVQPEPVASPSPSETPDAFIARLVQDGHAVLHDLDFAVGATTLDVSVNPELSAIATLLQDRPGLRIAVVGHTDTVGGLQTNINVSRARAGAVRSALIDSFDAPAGQIDAEGMGYLSPIASNLSPEGRNANRRVEVIVVSDDS